MSTDILLHHAADLLDNNAATLKSCHTVDGNWTGEEEAKAVHDDEATTAARLRVLAVHTGEAAPLCSRDCAAECEYCKDAASEAATTTGPVAVADLPAFPTMLRKMWSGTEVQQWIDDCIKPLVQERHHAFHCDAPEAAEDAKHALSRLLQMLEQEAYTSRRFRESRGAREMIGLAKAALASQTAHVAVGDASQPAAPGIALPPYEPTALAASIAECEAMSNDDDYQGRLTPSEAESIAAVLYELKRLQQPAIATPTLDAAQPADECNPADLCAGCRCAYGVQAAPDAPIAAQGDPLERAMQAAGQWANSNTPVSEALAYRDGFVAGARAPGEEVVALNDAELTLFAETAEQFEDCNETSTYYATLMRWASMGLLECEHFTITAAGNALLAGRDVSKAEPTS